MFLPAGKDDCVARCRITLASSPTSQRIVPFGDRDLQVPSRREGQLCCALSNNSCFFTDFAADCPVRQPGPTCSFPPGRTIVLRVAKELLLLHRLRSGLSRSATGTYMHLPAGS